MSLRKSLSPFWDTGFSPFNRLSSAAGPWEQALERFMNAPMVGETNGAAWMPEVDVKETDGGYELNAEVPGVAPEDINVSVTATGITVSGERSEEEKKEGDNFVHTERRYGSFQRSFTFPEQVDPDKVEASSKDGVLKVNVAKAKPSQVHRIKVNG